MSRSFISRATTTAFIMEVLGSRHSDSARSKWLTKRMLTLLAVPVLLSLLNIQAAFRLRPNNFAEQSRESVLENHSRGSVHRIAFITFSYIKHNDTNKLFNFLLPAVDTWAAPTPTPSSFDSEQDHNTTFNNPNEFKNVDHPIARDFPLYVGFSNTFTEGIRGYLPT